MVDYHTRHVQLEQQAEDTEKAVQERRQETDSNDVEPDDVEDESAAFQGCVVDHAATAMV